jgi:DNA-binding CsgD family transcriptional regulator/ketosteroid isomerase-like protein
MSYELQEKLKLAWSIPDMDMYLECWHKDAIYMDAVTGVGHRAGTELRDYCQKLITFFPKLKVEFTAFIYNDTEFANEWLMTGMHDENGEPIIHTGAGVGKLRDGKITQYHDYYVYPFSESSKIIWSPHLTFDDVKNLKISFQHLHANWELTDKANQIREKIKKNRLSKDLFSDAFGGRQIPSETVVLTTKAKQYLELIIEGLSQKEIAHIYHVTPNTVSRVLRLSYKKLNAKEPMEAAIKARALGLLWGKQ